MTRVLASLLALCLATSQALAEEATVTVELNKLEPLGGACQAYLVLENPGVEAYDELVLDLVMFDTGGIIVKRLALDIAPLRPGRTSVKVFSIQDLACDSLGRLLVNDVLSCSRGGTEEEACLSSIATTSRAGIELIN